MKGSVEMREVRFRAWHPEFGEMVYTGSTVLVMKREFSPFVFDVGFSHYPSDISAWKIMQFTGLKDRNGKEIFEGDIVSVPYVTPFGERTNKVDFKCLIGFENGRFVLSTKPETQSIASWCEREKGGYVPNYGNTVIIKDKTFLTVIGNIYENPELIER